MSSDSPSPKAIGLVGLLALYGASYWIYNGKIKINRYGEANYLYWDNEPFLFGFSVGSVACIGLACIWYWWRKR